MIGKARCAMALMGMFAGMTLMVPGLVMGAGQDGQVFGRGMPMSIRLLPEGQFRRSLEALPADAQDRALKWLQKISVTAADLEYLRTDPKGGIYFADTYVPEALAPEAVSEAAVITPSIASSDVFRLHSRPGASKVVFLDFDGHSITGTAWNDNTGETTLVALPYDLDGDISTFNTEERANIGEIWHRVAEDFAPFDIDVTTEEPASFNGNTGRILITRNVDANGKNMPSSTAGGVAYVGVFGASYYPSYSPALVYYNNLGGGLPVYVAEASTHEFGHNLGLSHDGVSGGSAYYTGHGTGAVSWAPIMGAAYYTNVTQWSQGEYTDANQTEDDMDIIRQNLGYRADDHGDSPATATALAVDSAGNILSSNPETDPFNAQPDNKGIIETRTDVDMFFLDVGTGNLSIAATPAWDAFTRTDSRGANLDIELSLYDSAGTLLAVSDPVDETNASISLNVAAGRYYLQVDGVGNSQDQGYTDYASVGQYFLSGQVVPGVAPTFDDVPLGHWAYDQIDMLDQRGITSGCGGNNYCPDGLVSRAEMAVFLEKAMNGGDFAVPAPSGGVFADVPAGHWAAGWIEKLASDGITGGCGGNNYCPDQNVTRAQMAVFLLRAKYGSDYVPPAPTGSSFADVPTDFWAAAWVESLAREGVTSGCGGGNFCPDAEVNRAQMAVFLVNTFGW